MIYFDNAATSWPKPDGMLQIFKQYLDNAGSPGRSGHEFSIFSSRIIHNARESIAKLFNVDDPSRIIFTKNITESINTVMFGLVCKGDHVITTDKEHNSVMRPLRFLEDQVISLSLINTSIHNPIDILQIEKVISKNTKLVVIGHGDNVVGDVKPIYEIAKLCNKMKITLLVDGAQTGGCFPVDLSDPIYNNTVFAFTGHKSLLGPTGTGGFIIGKDVQLKPMIYGGTGSLSEKDTQPDFLPDAFESGTMNVLGLAGLNFSVGKLIEMGVDTVHNKEMMFVDKIVKSFCDDKRIEIFNGKNPNATGIVSFRLKNLSTSETGYILSEKYKIMSRIGLHCNPLAHRKLGTYPDGLVRFSFSISNSLEEVEIAISAIKELITLKKS